MFPSDPLIRVTAWRRARGYIDAGHTPGEAVFRQGDVYPQGDAARDPCRDGVRILTWRRQTSGIFEAQ